jgi:hypothetical protein
LLVSWDVGGLDFYLQYNDDFVVSWDVAGCDVIAFVVSQDVARRTSRGLTSSAESFYVMPRVVAVRNVTNNTFTTEVSSSCCGMSQGAFLLDVIDGVFHRALGRRRARRHTSSTELRCAVGFLGFNVIGRLFRRVA